MFSNLRRRALLKAFFKSKKITTTDLPVFRALVIAFRQSVVQLVQDYLKRKLRCPVSTCLCSRGSAVRRSVILKTSGVCLIGR